uniref:G patch domain-containing protein 4 n=1 Tax=Apteryx owenii TaxID=8824 RepID=A0A8B9QWC6_APTOW
MRDSVPSSPGKGLGKREDGIAEAIKVKVKCDTAGVGHDPAEQFSFHWWDHVFNESAANLAVEAVQDGVSVKALSERDAGISNKKPRKAGGADGMLYGRFVKAATLTAHGEEAAKPPAALESSEEEEKLDLSSARRLTDEELIRACGGRTAHKGARHGLTMSAKLARLEEQERAFLATYGQKKGLPEAPESSPPAERQKKEKKKKKKQSRDRADPAAEQSQEPSGEENTAEEEEKVSKRKKKKKKHKELVEHEETETEAPLGEADEPDHAGHSPKKKKKRKKRQQEAE